MHPNQIGPLINKKWWEESKREFSALDYEFENRGRFVSSRRH